MSLLPYFFDDWEWPRPRHQHFGLALRPEDIFGVSPQNYFRPWRHLVTAAARDLGSNIKLDKDKFQVNVDVQHFSPDEITVKTHDGYVLVEGKHEERKDEHGYISRHFVRRYALPEGTKAELVESKLSSDGVLTVCAPRNAPKAAEGERLVPISQTGPVRKEIKDQSTEETKQNGENGM